ncbi:hypothetical protein PAMP_013585 [Pampus punctatissimus]
MEKSVLGLYHNLITGSKKFPEVPFIGHFCVLKHKSPFVETKQEQRENTKPSPVMDAPAGIMVPTAGSGSSPPTMLTPVISERTTPAALKADRRNCVRTLEVGGSTIRHGAATRHLICVPQ